MAPICSICQTQLDGSAESAASALQCGHVFHEACVNEWFSKATHTCPSCRAKCSQKRIIRLFLDSPVLDAESSTAQLERLANSNLEQSKRLTIIQAQLAEKTKQLNKVCKEKSDLSAQNKAMKVAMIRAGELEAKMKTFDKLVAERDRLKLQVEASVLYECVMSCTHPEREIDRLIQSGVIEEAEMHRLMRSQQAQMKQKHEHALKTLRTEIDELKRSLRDKTNEVIRLKKQKRSPVVNSERSPRLRSPDDVVIIESPPKESLKPSTPPAPKHDDSVIVLSPGSSVSVRRQRKHNESIFSENNSSMSLSFLNTPGPSTSGIRVGDDVVYHNNSPSLAIKRRVAAPVNFKNYDRVSFSLAEIPRKKKSNVIGR